MQAKYMYMCIARGKWCFKTQPIIIVPTPHRDWTPAGECGVCGVECGRWDGGGCGLEQRRPLTMDSVRVSTPLFPW